MRDFLKKFSWVYNLKSYFRSIEPRAQSLLFYDKLLNFRDKVVFDIGANIGIRTAMFRELGALVVSVDPNTDICKGLQNSFGNSIMVENVGVGSFNGLLKLSKGSSSTISTFNKEHLKNVKAGLFKDYSFNRYQLSRITTLETLIEKYGKPEFIKIDVEGFESEVLKGLSQPINGIQFEFMFNYELGWEYFLDCINEIHRISTYYEFNITISESYELVLKKFYSKDEFVSIIENEYLNKKIWGDVICILQENQRDQN